MKDGIRVILTEAWNNKSHESFGAFLDEAIEEIMCLPGITPRADDILHDNRHILSISSFDLQKEWVVGKYGIEQIFVYAEPDGPWFKIWANGKVVCRVNANKITLVNYEDERERGKGELHCDHDWQYRGECHKYGCDKCGATEAR